MDEPLDLDGPSTDLQSFGQQHDGRLLAVGCWLAQKNAGEPLYIVRVGAVADDPTVEGCARGAAARSP